MVGPVGGAGIAAAIAAVPGTLVTAATTMEDVPAALTDAPILVTFRWDDAWVVPGLRWIQSVSAGTDQFPLASLAANGTVLTSARGIHEIQVSEHALGLLLAMTRGIAPAILQQRDRSWRWPPVTDLAGKTLGVLGLGVIGEGVARRAAAFGMRVIGTKSDPASYDGVAERVFPPDDTIEVFRAADAVIITLPDTPATRGLVGREALDALSGGWLVNVGRGAVIDEGALVAAMEEGVLAGAALDVFATEPLPSDSPLWDLPGVIITPHVAGSSPAYGDRLAGVFAHNLAAFHGRAEWRNRVV